MICYITFLCNKSNNTFRNILQNAVASDIVKNFNF